MFDFELRERADEDAASADYDALYHGSPLARYWDDDFFEFVRAVCNAGDRVLDLGCGPGSHWPYWTQLPTSSLVGVDLSEGMISVARERNPGGDFRVGRVHELPFPSGSFDVVIASAVLHHIPESHLESALAEIVRVLDEHGRIVGREPSGCFFGSDPGWLSGALMHFRHLAYRLTASRERPEPQLGEHHAPLDRRRFLDLLGTQLKVTRVEQRFPFSPYVVRVHSPFVVELAQRFDRMLFDRPGTMFYFLAERNHYTAEDVEHASRMAAAASGVSDAEFLAHLTAAARELERRYGTHGGRP